MLFQKGWQNSKLQTGGVRFFYVQQMRVGYGKLIRADESKLLKKVEISHTTSMSHLLKSS